jgi:hypothetical protein
VEDDQGMGLLARCIDRLGSAFVTEVIAEDGTRLVVALDPNSAFGGMSMIVVTWPVSHGPTFQGPDIDGLGQACDRSGSHQSATWAANRVA